MQLLADKINAESDVCSGLNWLIETLWLRLFSRLLKTFYLTANCLLFPPMKFNRIQLKLIETKINCRRQFIVWRQNLTQMIC